MKTMYIFENCHVLANPNILNNIIFDRVVITKLVETKIQGYPQRIVLKRRHSF